MSRHVWTIAELDDALHADPTDTMKKYRVVFAHGKGVWWDSDKTFNHQRGIKMENVAEFVEKHLKSRM